jgi:hypothetical protein
MTHRDEHTTDGETTGAVPDGGVESSVTPGDPGVGVGRSPLRSVVRLLRGETRDIELWTRIGSLEAELDVLDSRLDEDDATSQARVRSARNLLSDAKRRLDRGRVEEAWGHYHTALRMVVFVFEAVGDGGTLSAQCRAVYEEALDALAGGPRRTVVALLTDGSDVQTPPPATDLAEAMRVLHDQYERVALTRRYLQSQFNQLLLQGSVSLVLLFLLAVGAVYDLSPLLVEPLTTTDLRSIGFALYVVLVGIIGASVFGIRTLRDRPLSTRATQKLPGLFVTGARVFIGATSALFLVFVLFTELVSFDQAVTAPMALAVAFAGGYSERLAPQAVDTVSQVVPSQIDGTDGRATKTTGGTDAPGAAGGTDAGAGGSGGTGTPSGTGDS